jgi:hypothetical protein
MVVRGGRGEEEMLDGTNQAGEWSVWGEVVSMDDGSVM